MSAESPMKFIGEANGLKYYWAEPGHFVNPGVHCWNGEQNVYCDPALIPRPGTAAPEQATTGSGDSGSVYLGSGECGNVHKPLIKGGVLHIKVSWIEQGFPPFIYWAHGHIGGNTLAELEEELVGRPEDICDKGFGDYEFRVTWDPGQYGEYGVCELAPYWDFGDVSFTPLSTASPAGEGDKS